MYTQLHCVEKTTQLHCVVPFVEKTIPYPLNCLCIYLCEFIYTSKQYSVLLTRLFLHQHHSIFIAALCVLKSGDIGPPPLFSFSKLFWLFWILSILLRILESAWQIQTTIPRPQFFFWDFVWDCCESINLFGKNWHLTFGSFDPWTQRMYLHVSRSFLMSHSFRYTNLTNCHLYPWTFYILIAIISWILISISDRSLVFSYGTYRMQL